MSVWEESKDSYSGLQCNFQPRCIWCDLPMQLFDIKLIQFLIPDGMQDRRGNAIDVVMWCENCGFTDVFGVAVSQKHRKKIEDKIIEGIKEKEFTHVVMEKEANT